MGRPVMRHPFKFLCFGIALLGVALSPLLVPGLSGGSQGGGSPGPIPTSPWPPAVRNATIGTLPTMGWNSWNHFACGIDENLIKQIADAMVNGGLQAAGYDVVTLDACWSARNRDAAGNLSNDPQTFPSGMKALGDYIHARGLRFGLYASIGTRMCGDVGPGSLDHEVQDVDTLASWGVDYIKADRCSADGLVMKDLYARWRDAIAVSGRPIVLSASDNIAVQEPWAWVPVTAHQWRMSGCGRAPQPGRCGRDDRGGLGHHRPRTGQRDRAGLGSAAGSRELHRQLQRERTRARIGAAPNPRDRSSGGRRIPERPALDLHGE